MFIKKMNKKKFDVMDYIAENLMMLRRAKEGLGVCIKTECL
jgi:hypothetical protein